MWLLLLFDWMRVHFDAARHIEPCLIQFRFVTQSPHRIITAEYSGGALQKLPRTFQENRFWFWGSSRECPVINHNYEP